MCISVNLGVIMSMCMLLYTILKLNSDSILIRQTGKNIVHFFVIAIVTDYDHERGCGELRCAEVYCA